jgi:hypothetical protein
MIDTKTWTVEEAIESVDSQLSDVLDDLEGLDSDSARYEAEASTAQQLDHRLDGLYSAREEWGPEAEVTLSAPTAGDHAKVDRKASDNGQRERVLWLVAQCSESGPHVGDDLTETFQSVAGGLHDGLVRWMETEVNNLSSAEGREGNWRTRLLERSTTD